MADEQTPLTPFQQIQRRQQQRDELKVDVQKGLEAQREVEAAAETDEEQRGLFADAGVGLVRAAPGFAEESFDLLASIDEWSMRKFGALDLNPFDGNGVGFVSPEVMGQRVEGGDVSPFRVPENGWSLILDQIPETERFSGAFTEATAKFLMGFYTGRTMLQGVGVLQGASRTQQIANAMAAGGIADVLAFDGHEGRLSDLIQATAEEGGFPDISNGLTELLASDPDDTELEGRLKNTIEGAGLGVFTDLLLMGVRNYRTLKRNQALSNAADQADNIEPRGDVDVEDSLRAADEAEVAAAARPDLEVRRSSDPELAAVDIDEGITEIVLPRAEPRDTLFQEGGIHLADDMAGRVELRSRGDNLQVTRSIVEPEARGTGEGVRMYEEAARVADEGNQRLVSDTVVTEDAARVWESLQRRGHEIIDNRANAELVDGRWESSNGQPVFERVRGPEPTARPDLDEGARAADELEAETLRGESTRVTMDLDPDQVAALRAAIDEGDIEGAEKVLNDFNAEKIDWDAIESADDIYQVLRATEEVMADVIGEAKGGVQSVAFTTRTANMVNASADQVKKMFDDVRGDNGLAVRFTAARRTLLASARELKRRAIAVRDADAATVQAAEIAYMRQAQIHTALQARIKGTQTEIARTLRMMRETNSQVAAEFHELDQIRAQFAGGSGRGDAFNRHINELIQMGDLTQINRHVDESFRIKLKNAFIEYTINAMLSSLKTHAINITSNVLNTALYTVDRVMVNAARGLMGNQAAWRELRIELAHKVIELPAAFKTAMQALREGLPVSDMRQRMEFQNRKAIGADLLGLSDASWMGKTMNFIGEVIRLPGRALIGGDEFFKTWNRNTEMHVQAFRRADSDASARGFDIGTPEYESFVDRRMAQLLDEQNNSRAAIEVRESARDRARLTTFQEQGITTVGPAFERALNSSALLKLVIAPFYRTPMNILRQGVIDRTPLGLLLDRHRATIRAGGPEAAEAITRMTTGTAAMGTLWMMMDGWKDNESSGIQIVGKIPWDSSARASGVREYSIKLGDEWYQFNRLDPLGMWIGMVADAHELANFDEEVAANYVQFSVAAFSSNVLNKTWAKSLSDFMDMATRIESGRPATVQRAINQIAAGELGKLIPQIVKSSRDLEGEREAKEVWGVLDILQSQIPVMNKDLPPRHDAVGRPITWESGFGSMVNPFMNSKMDTPLDKKLFELDFTVRPMRKTYGNLELTDQEYSKLTGLVNRDNVLVDTLSALVADPEFNEAPPGIQTQIIKKQIASARQTARALMLVDEDFVRRVQEVDAQQLNELFQFDDEDL